MLTSIQNERIKKYKKLMQRKYREREQLFLIEGMHLVTEAIRAQFTLLDVLYTEDVSLPNGLEDIRTTLVSEKVLEHLSQTETPQGILAVVKMKKKPAKTGSRVLLLDGVQDPGNVGTLIRTALAFGYKQIVLGRGTVDVYNDKVLRATQGAVFHVDIEMCELSEKIKTLHDEGFTVWATALEDAVSVHEAESSEKLALVLGNEGSGIQEEILQLADQKITIPIEEATESLNVAIAGSILMYETNRQNLRK